MDEKEVLVGQFCSVADATPERARFYLESADWQLEVALSSFYDNPSAGEESQMEGIMDEDFRSPDDPEPPGSQPSPSTAHKIKVDKSQTKKSSKFASIRDLEKDDDQNSEEEGQRFYAGGSEHSGELIVGPPRKKKSNDEIAKNLFKQAKEHGAQAIDASTRDSGISGDSKPKYFGGGGYKLGESNDPSEFIRGNEEAEEARPVNVILRLWSNGFTVDDGPLRDFNDPANEDFLNSIKKGEIPRELLRHSLGGQVHVDMEDHRQEEYKAPKKKIKPFSGQGHMLGSPTPEFYSTATPVPSLSSSVDPPVVVDKSKPTTTLQIRLASGKKLRQEFNQTHRISDIRSFVISSSPESASRPFVLMTTFPNKELTEEQLSLSEAKLLNALVVQKMV